MHIVRAHVDVYGGLCDIQLSVLYDLAKILMFEHEGEASASEFKWHLNLWLVILCHSKRPTWLLDWQSLRRERMARFQRRRNGAGQRTTWLQTSTRWCPIVS